MQSQWNFVSIELIQIAGSESMIFVGGGGGETIKQEFTDGSTAESIAREKKIRSTKLVGIIRIS